MAAISAKGPYHTVQHCLIHMLLLAYLGFYYEAAHLAWATMSMRWACGKPYCWMGRMKGWEYERLTKAHLRLPIELTTSSSTREQEMIKVVLYRGQMRETGKRNDVCGFWYIWDAIWVNPSLTEKRKKIQPKQRENQRTDSLGWTMFPYISFIFT